MATSEYCQKLAKPERDMYLAKFIIIDVDHYLVKQQDCSSKIVDLPKVLYPDIVMYLVHSESEYTMEEMCAYKSLKAYNQATCGWLRNIIVKKIGMYSLVLVIHSQRLQEKYLSPWIITKQTGEIETAHCDCVAGFSRVCTHVSAVLFVIDKEVRNAEEVTRTGIKAYWLPPTNKPTEPKRVANIDLRTSKRMYSDDNSVITYKKSKESITSISVSEQNVFLSDLMDSDEIVVSHLVTEPFAEQLKDKFN